jgi:thymidylate synthase
VRDGKYLDCQMYQRSADWFLGVPFNIASYALLTHIVARRVGLEAGEFIHTFGDYHLYTNHIDAAKEQLARSSMPDLPQLRMNIPDWADGDLMDLQPEWFEVVGYAPHPYIKAPIAV